MNRRAARALRLAAGVRAVATAVGVVCYSLGWLWPSDPGASIETVLRHVEIVTAVQRWSALGGAAVMLLSFAVMFSALERRARALTAGALAAVALQLALLIFNMIVPAQMSQVSAHARRLALWLVQIGAQDAGLLLALLAAAAAAPAGRRERGAIVAFAAFAGLLFLLRIVSFVATPSVAVARALSIGWLAADTVAIIAFVLAAFWLARGLEQSGAAATDAAPAAPGNRDPHPLRLLGRTIIVRVAVGAPLAIIAAVGTARGAPGIGMLALAASTVTGLVVTAMLVMSLVGQRQLPAALCDREALTLAIVLACLAPVFEVWSAVSTGQILSLIGEAQRATSFWGMPSLSRIEELQTAASWTGRASICLGLGGSFAIVRSLAATARGLGDETLTSRARRVRGLLTYGTGGAITAWIFVSTVEIRGDAALLALVVLGVGLLTIGIVLIGELLRLTFGLASALERPAPAAAEVSSAFPS